MRKHNHLELDGVEALEQIAECVCEIRHDIKRIANAVAKLVPNEVTNFTLNQIIEGESMAINGTILGQTSEFQIGLVPATGAVPLQSGPTVSVDDTNVTLSAVGTDGSGNLLTFTAATVTSDTATSYNLTITGVNGAGATITHVFNVPLLPQPVVQVSDFSLNQLS